MFDLNKLADGKSAYATTALNVVAGAALLCAASWFSYNMFSTRDAELPVRVINSIVIEPSILLAGKPFTTHINVTLTKLCPYEVHWSLARKVDGVEVVKLIDPVRQPPAQLGTQDLPPLVRYTPMGIEPGEYRYIGEVFDLCPNSHSITPVRRNLDITIR